MDERLQFVRDAMRDRFTMSELCARYGVSRRIGYKWLARYDAEGRRGLTDRSRAPRHCPHRIATTLAELLVAERLAHPHWALESSCRSSPPGIRASGAGPQRAPRLTCWRGAAWCNDGVVDGPTCIPA